MTDTVASALRQSRELAPDQRGLPLLFAAEETIARMPDEDVMELQTQLGATPTDGFLYLWLGLAARERKQWKAALDALGHAITHGCSHWRVGWYIAQAARGAGQLQLVDQACAAVLKANPKFWFARELPKHARGYYSQIGQDKIVEQFFAHCPPRTKVFVEVGAFDGLHYSNVRRLHEKHGWTGISFEPVSKNFKKLAASYSGTAVKCVQAAVSRQDGELEINVSTYPHLPEWGSDVATLGEADTARWEREFGAKWTKEKVPVRRLARLLDEAGIRDFDFMSIDTEGHDLEVIRGIDFDRFRPQMIVVEYGEHRVAILQYLLKQGYSLLQDNTQDFVMARVQHQPCEHRLLPDTLNLGGTGDRPAPVALVNEITEKLAGWLWREPKDVRNLVVVAPAPSFAAEKLLGLYPSATLHVVRPGMTKLPANSRIRTYPEIDDVTRKAGSGFAADLLWFFDRGDVLSLSDRASLLFDTAGMLLAPFGPAGEAADDRGCPWRGVDRLAVAHGCYLAAIGLAPAGDGSGYGAWLRLPPSYERPAATLTELHERFARLQGCRTKYTNGTTFGMGQLYQGFKRLGIEGQRSTERRLETYNLEQYLRPTDRLLDIGCNCGFMTMSLAHFVREVRGIDADRGVVAIAREAARYLKLDNCSFDVQPFHEFDVTQHFDVICSFAVHHWLGVPFADYVGRIWQMLNPGGRLIFESHDLRTTDRDLEAKLGVLDKMGLRLRHHGKLYENKSEYPRLFFVFEKPVPAGPTSDPRLAGINPHLLTILPAEAFGSLRDYAPDEALNSRRFDIPAKYIYARHRELGLDVTWSRALYVAHIKAFNGGSEGDGSGKDSVEKFIGSFDETLDSLKRSGFNSGVSLLPVSAQSGAVIDGGHRAAACLLYNITAKAIEADYNAPAYDWQFFKRRGLAVQWCDAIAFEAARLSSRLRLLVVTSEDPQSLDQQLTGATALGAVYYERTFNLNARGVANLRHELGTAQTAGVKARACYAGAVLLEPGLHSSAAPSLPLRPSSETSALPAPDASTCWMTTTSEETTRLAALVFSGNGIDFLNLADPAFAARRADFVNGLLARVREGENIEWLGWSAEAALALCGVEAFGAPNLLKDGRLPAELAARSVTDTTQHFVYHGLKFPALELAKQIALAAHPEQAAALKDVLDKFVGAAPPRPEAIPFSFSNNWFKAHEPHWNELLIPWARQQGQPLNILEVGAYEGRSSCWFITHLLGDGRSRLTCIDPWKQASSIRVYDDNMEEVFETFQHNVRLSGRGVQVRTMREDSSVALRGLADKSFDLIYIDGDHSADGVYADTLEAFRLLKEGGMILWDDYYWCDTVREGVDRACAESGVKVVRFGKNASFQKPFSAVTCDGGPKIVALIPARNEAARLPFCLRALKPYVDAVVYLDDCSDDDSVAVVESLADECKVGHIIRKTQWLRDEPGDRNALLAAGRKLGGTHFVVLDADEAFTANCAEQNYLRRLVLTLRPGDTLTLSWIQLWRSLGEYRFDQSQWTYASKAFAFCDDGQATYQSGFIHTQRVPKGLAGRNIPVVNYVHGVLHFQFVNWPNLQIKQAWYRCMERIRQPHRAAAEINKQYAPSEDESGLQLREVPADWLEGYAGLDASVFAARDERRVREVLAWFNEHGAGHFADLDIWRVDWAALCPDESLAAAIREASRRAPVAPRTFTIPPEARRHMTQAGEHLSRRDLAACRKSVECALAEAPDHPEILAALGNMELVAKEFADARKHFEASLALNPAQPKIWAQLATVQLRLKNRAGFLQALQKALDLDLKCVPALRLMADYQVERGQHRAAAGAYHQLVELEPRDASLRMNLGQALAACGEPEEAAQAYRHALSLDPNLVAARRALDALSRGKPRAAAPAAEACVR